MTRFTLKPSRRIALVVALAHLLTLSVVWTLPLATWVLGLLSAAVIASALWQVAIALHRHPRAVVEVSLDQDHALALRYRDGTRFEGTLSPQSVVLSWLAIVVGERQGVRLQLFKPSVLVSVDGLDAQAFRELRVLMKWGRAQRA